MNKLILSRSRSGQISIMLIAMLALVTSCKKGFLEQTNPQTVGFEHVTDLKSLNAATIGVYSKFKQANYYNGAFTIIPELIGDNAFISIRNGGRYTNHDNFTVTNGDGYVTGAWGLMWEVIVNANQAIHRGSQIEFRGSDVATANQLLGELYSCRALAYFDLVRFFAQPYNFTPDAGHLGVPLVTDPPERIISPSRSSVAEVYDQIISDLQTAEGLLLPARKDGFFDLHAARALLAKVYLYKEDWQNAITYATKVIDESPYTLLTNANYVASWEQKFSSESLFEVANTPTSNSGVNSIGYLTEQGAYGELLATQDLYDTYSATDVRRQLIQPGSRPNGESNAYFIKKYPRGAATRDDNIKVLRLSEVYLIRAEAYAELSKLNPSYTTQAVEDLHTIMKRADPSAADIMITGQDLVDRVILERRKELAFEGNRLFDINRKKMDLIHIETDRTRVFTYPNNRFIMPIPYSERNANKNIEPNPGWN
jgi:hypothetical protein